MLPVVDKPLVQYAVEEAFDSGIEQIIFVTSAHKGAMEDHFDRSHELEETLRAKGKDDIVKAVEATVPIAGTIVSTRQQEPLGLGHAIWCARDMVGNEPFVVLLPDDLIQSKIPVLSQMLKKFEAAQASMVAVIEVNPSETSKYGILDAEDAGESMCRIKGMVEKPKPEEAPSNLAIIGRYILTPEIFKILDQKKTGAGGEIQITDAMEILLKEQPIYGYHFEGTRFDCGDKAGFQMANLAYAMERPEIGPQLGSYIKSIIK